MGRAVAENGIQIALWRLCRSLLSGRGRWSVHPCPPRTSLLHLLSRDATSHAHRQTDRQTVRQSDRHKHTCDHTRECSTIIGTPPVLAPPWAGSEEYQHRQPPGDCGCAVYPRSIHLRNFPCRPAGRGCRRLRQKALFHSNPSAYHARVSVCACVHTWAPYTCACT